MIIWGSRGLTSVVENGQFHCPQCGTDRMFNLKQVRNFFTLYFIPLIPLNVAGRYVECGSCGGTFSEETKSYDPEKERQEMHTRMLRVMLMAATAYNLKKWLKFEFKLRISLSKPQKMAKKMIKKGHKMLAIWNLCCIKPQYACHPSF